MRLIYKKKINKLETENKENCQQKLETKKVAKWTEYRSSSGKKKKLKTIILL
jgi:hypothetical protein